MKSVSKKEILTKWLEIRSSLRRANRELREAIELFRLLDPYRPWLVEFHLREVDKSSFEILRKWMEAGTNICRANKDLQVAHKQLSVLEERHPWLLTVKEIVGKAQEKYKRVR